MDRRAVWRDALWLALIVGVGGALRLYGLNWDGGQWLQPDERQIYFVALGLGWPQSLAEAFSPASPLNPHFFAYGSLPIYLVRLIALLVAAAADPDNLHLVGRPLAVLFDLGTIILTYCLARQLWPTPRAADARETRVGVDGGAIGLLSAALVSFAVLHVQLAHFYASEPLLAFLVMLALNLAVAAARRPTLARAAALGGVVGLALATKVSAAPLFVVVLAALYRRAPAQAEPGSTDASAISGARSDTRYASPSLRLLVAALAAGLAFTLAEPYALIDWPTFLADTVRESQIAWGMLDVPYTRQYAGTLPYLYPAWQLALWGLGVPAGVVVWSGLAVALARWLRRGDQADTLLLAWAVPALAITGALYAKPLRYLLPLVPVLCLLGARLLVGQPPSVDRPGRARLLRSLTWVLVLLSAAYALAFESVYRSPHSWIAASQWIYRQVPAGNALAVEAWDAALPLPLELGGRSRRIEEYEVRTLELYDEPDDEAKWALLSAGLASSDYVIVASRRGYGSIGRLPERYPLTSRYYALLFGGELGFELAGEFTRGPAWLNPSVAPLPGAVARWLVPDESFVVYDHPRALVFYNAQRLPARELFQRLVH